MEALCINLFLHDDILGVSEGNETRREKDDGCTSSW